jgi:putative transposase
MQDNYVIDILVQKRRDKRAAERFFRNMLKQQSQSPRRMITDKLKSYGAARKEVMPSVVHFQDRYANNLAEASHQQTRQRERQMRRFKSPRRAQRFLSVHSQVHNLFRVGRHLLKACRYRKFRSRSFSVLQEVTCA